MTDYLSLPAPDSASNDRSIRVFDDKREPQADIAYTSYQLDGADRASRPVTFLFNGGPGASASLLHVTGLGPKIVRMVPLASGSRIRTCPSQRGSRM
jgi:carboxypeptidase C (cathepsin A)